MLPRIMTSTCYLPAMVCTCVKGTCVYLLIYQAGSTSPTYLTSGISQIACLRTKLELSPSDGRLLKVGVILSFNFKKKVKLQNKTRK